MPLVHSWTSWTVWTTVGIDCPNSNPTKICNLHSSEGIAAIEWLDLRSAGPEICLSTTIHTYWIATCDYQTNECHHGPVWYAAAKKLYSMCAWKSKAELSPPFTRSCVLNDSLGTFWARPWIDEVKMASFVKYCLKAVNPKLAQWKSRAEQGIFTIGHSQTFRKNSLWPIRVHSQTTLKSFWHFLTTYPPPFIFSMV